MEISIDWALKTNERAIAKNMPLLSEYANYGDSGTDARRWEMMLYNRPSNLGIDYFVNNLKGLETSKIDVEAGGLLKNKAKSKIDENETAILKGELEEPVGYDWAFQILREKRREPEGAPIVRIVKQLGEMERVITRELE